jgi:hypothetical protein
MKMLTTFLIVSILAMAGAITLLKKSNSKLKDEVAVLKHENRTMQSQYETMTWDNQNALTLSRYEYSKLRTDLTAKIDSLLKANRIKPKEIVSATVIENKYTDTTKVKAVTKQPENVNNSYIIPVSWDNGCWGMVGEISTSDKLAELSILNRKFSNSIQLVVTREKKFLFIRLKRASYNVFSDCGTVNIESIKFTN